MLPSNESVPIPAAVRGASLWLKRATCNDIIDFLNANTAIALAARDELLAQLQVLINRTASSGKPGERRLFTHPYYWGSFTVSGHGGLAGAFVSPLVKEKTGGRARAEKRSQARDAKNDMKDMQNIRFEIAALRGEGNEVEADQLKEGLEEIHRKQVAFRRKQFASHIDNAKQSGMRAKTWLVDRLKQLDRAILEQDSDEEEEKKKGRPELQNEQQPIASENPPLDHRRTPGLISEDSEEIFGPKMVQGLANTNQDDDSSYENDGNEDGYDDKDNGDDDRRYRDEHQGASR